MEEYRNEDKEVKWKYRRDKGEHMNNLIPKANGAAAKIEQGTLYRITKKISAKYNSGSSVCLETDIVTP